MIAHLTSRHKSNDARIFLRAVTTLRKEHCVFYYCRDDNLIETSQNNIKFKSYGNKLHDFILCIKMFWHASLNSKVKIIHFHDPEFLPFTWLPWLFGKVLVYDIHENFHVKFQFGSWFKRRIGGVAFKCLEWFSFRFIEGLVTVSESLREKYSDYTTCSVIVRNVPLKSTLSFLKADESRSPYRVYVSGNHSEQRNCSNILRALPKVINEISEVQLLLVGKYRPEGYEDHLLSLAKELGISEKVSLEPMKSYLENLALASQSGIGLVLYEDNVNNRVGMPNRLFEYMAVGIPVVVEDFPELRSIIKEYKCGVCVDSADPDALARAILKVLHDPEFANTMGSNGQIAVRERVNFEEESKEMVKLYSCLKVKLI